MKLCRILAFLITFLSKAVFVISQSDDGKKASEKAAASSELIQYSIYSANISDHFDVNGNLRDETFSVRLNGPKPESAVTCILIWGVEDEYDGSFGNEALNCTDHQLSARLMRATVEGFTGWGLTVQYE